MQITMPHGTPTDANTRPDFDLDVTIIEGGPVVPEPVMSTSDGCGHTCESACTSCKSD
jgi:FxLD family lantipeptide